ncbi:hypothetical protein BDW02DRAFT_601682 [Decorospora gaudefroyi]|uniref:Uncharacterized protein n=1 Tax=Decorospora gaudefroyi TaxID=184978 RepID=A0A6A5K292_9PLEO|nr:hypothetical protein BDW02DRAFT_601682 [Decorospora gaudefroyi]
MSANTAVTLSGATATCQSTCKTPTPSEQEARQKQILHQKQKAELAQQKAAAEVAAKGSKIFQNKPNMRGRQIKKGRKPLPKATNKSQDAETVKTSLKSNYEKSKAEKAKLGRASSEDAATSNGHDTSVAATSISTDSEGVEMGYRDMTPSDSGSGDADCTLDRHHFNNVSTVGSEEDISFQLGLQYNFAYTEIVEQRMVGGVVETFGQPQHIPSTTSSGAPWLVGTEGTTVEEVPIMGPPDTTIDTAVSPSQGFDGFVAGLLSMPNGTGTTMTSRDRHEKLVVLHIKPFQLPVSERERAKKPITSESSDVPVNLTAQGTYQKLSATVATGEEDLFIGSFLSIPNGSGETKEIRDLCEYLVAMHVTPLELPQPKPKDVKNAEKSSESAETLAFDKLAVDGEPAVADKLTFIDESPSDHELAQVEQSHGAAEYSDRSLSGSIPEPEALCEQITVSAEDLIVAADVAAPDVSPPTSARGRSRCTSDTAVSPKPMSRRSSTPPNNSPTDIDIRIHLARTTFLGLTSLAVFVETMHFEADGTTTKTDIRDAFASLVMNDTEESHTGRRPTPVYTDFESPRTQRRLKLGNTSLYDFLRLIQFDGEEVTSVVDVMQAFREAAQKEDSLSDKLVAALRLEASLESGGSCRLGRAGRSYLSGSN